MSPIDFSSLLSTDSSVQMTETDPPIPKVSRSLGYQFINFDDEIQNLSLPIPLPLPERDFSSKKGNVMKLRPRPLPYQEQKPQQGRIVLYKTQIAPRSNPLSLALPNNIFEEDHSPLIDNTVTDFTLDLPEEIVDTRIEHQDEDKRKLLKRPIPLRLRKMHLSPSTCPKKKAKLLLVDRSSAFDKVPQSFWKSSFSE